MRQIGTIANETEARQLVDYLLTLGIVTAVRDANGSWELWVRDEDHVQRAGQELDEFRKNPGDARFQKAKEAERLRLEKLRADEQYRRSVIHLRERWSRPSLATQPLTFLLMAACIGLAVWSQFGRNLEIVSKLTIASIIVDREDLWLHGFRQIRQGEVWRLITPILLHFGWVHLLFNMYALYDFGGLVEKRYSTWRFLGLVLVIGVFSNLVQFYYSGHPMFGGMSGVLFGLFGYIWMKSRFDPGSGVRLHREGVIYMLVWLVLCMTGWMGNIANAAHVAGLVAGIVIGIAPYLWKRLFRA